MTFDDTPQPSASRSVPPAPSVGRPPLPWLLIIGLSSLALLWPLTAMWELGQGLPRALALLGLTAAVWIGAAVGGRLHRPVAVLTLAGLLHGGLALMLAGVLSGGSGPFGNPAALWILLPSLAGSAGLGALLGLVAAGILRVLGARGSSAEGEL